MTMAKEIRELSDAELEQVAGGKNPTISFLGGTFEYGTNNLGRNYIKVTWTEDSGGK